MAKGTKTERIGVKCGKCGHFAWFDVVVEATVTEMEIKTKVSEAPEWKV